MTFHGSFESIEKSLLNKNNKTILSDAEKISVRKSSQHQRKKYNNLTLKSLV